MTDLPPTQFVTVNGLRLAYCHWPGRPGAPALLCLPHLTGHKGSYADLAAALSPDYAVYALDLRGRGESDQPAEGYGFAYHAADLLACADAWGLPAFSLIGHSFGATAATYLASIRPQRVRALVLLDGGADPKDATLRAMYPTIGRLDQTFASVAAYLDAMRALSFFQPWDAALERYFRADVLALPDGTFRARSSAAAIARDLDAHFMYSMCLHFPAVRCPTLFVRPQHGLRGDRGHVFSEAEAAAIARHIPHCQRAEVPGCNHYTLLLAAGPPALPAVRAFSSLSTCRLCYNSRMDILLAHGYFLADDAHERRVMKPYPTLGLLYLSAYLKARGYGVSVFDATFQTPADFERALQAQRPTVVGLYTNLMTKFNVLQMMTASHAVGARVVLGGPEPASYAAEYLAHGADAIVVGEGELTLEDLLARRFTDLHAIPGLIYLGADGQVVTNAPRPYIADLNTLPFPDRDAIDLDRYVQVWRANHGQGSVSLITARGCPFHCQWCSHAVYGNTHRRRLPENVADELEMLLGRYQPDQVWYADDVFTIHRRWFLEYARLLKARNLRAPFECISRPDRLDEEVIAALAEMGCYRLWLGSESGSQRVLDAMKRETKVTDVQAKTKLLQKQGIQVGMFIMLGYEAEELSDLDATTEHLKASNPDLFLTTVAYPIKGTPYHTQVSDRVLAPAGWEHVSDRDLSVRGRYSRRFYSFATRWMVNRVALHREWHGPRQPLRLAKTLANTVLGRAGMLATLREREA